MDKKTAHFLADGIILVHKPIDMTSSEVVRRVKRWLKPKKIGHGGTLDPFAEGLMVLLINKGTKIADQFLDDDKTYEFTIFFGQETDTLARTGEVVHRYDGAPIPRCTLEDILPSFRGPITQKVPAYAAAKVKGERLYKLARKGVVVDTPTKPVTVYDLTLLHYEWPRARLKARCSKGTYVRQLGSDIARAAGCYGFLEHLVRTQTGKFTLEDAWSLEEIEQLAATQQTHRLVVPLVDALDHLPIVVVEREEIERLRSGQISRRLERDEQQATPFERVPVRVVNTSQDILLALWWPHRGREQKKMLKVLI